MERTAIADPASTSRPVVGSQHRIAANSAVADRQRRVCAVGGNATAKTGSRIRVTPAGKVSTDSAASDYRSSYVVNSAPTAANRVAVYRAVGDLKHS